MIQSGWRTISNDLFDQLQFYKNKSNLSSDWILTFNESIGLKYKKYISTKTLAIEYSIIKISKIFQIKG